MPATVSLAYRRHRRIRGMGDATIEASQDTEENDDDTGDDDTDDIGGGTPIDTTDDTDDFDDSDDSDIEDDTGSNFVGPSANETIVGPSGQLAVPNAYLSSTSASRPKVAPTVPGTAPGTGPGTGPGPGGSNALLYVGLVAVAVVGAIVVKKKRAKRERTNPKRGRKSSTMEIIEKTAEKCAAEQIAQGWAPEWQYDLGNFYGDKEALEDALGRPATSEEKIEFEADMRSALSRRR